MPSPTAAALLGVGARELAARAMRVRSAGDAAGWFTAAWTGLEGAREYRAAVEAGDVAPDTEVERRFALCLACPIATRPRAGELWCGTPLAERGAEGCGCLCAGKVCVASEACPRETWGGVEKEEGISDQPSGIGDQGSGIREEGRSHQRSAISDQGRPETSPPLMADY